MCVCVCVCVCVRARVCACVCVHEKKAVSCECQGVCFAMDMPSWLPHFWGVLYRLFFRSVSLGGSVNTRTAHCLSAAIKLSWNVNEGALAKSTHKGVG